ncbi:hypothetical protein [Endozoicomonas arenosclerae]|uniref:hypothetical protein n=1 Tax=Endozoicomonas arenosclerae TaxID=1633495 RepID=UPI000783B745|nr:hypothetical protein [Endozoicomonas arenosclerae]
MSDKKIDPKDPDFIAEQVEGSMNIEGFKLPEEERETLKKIVKGELDVDEVADTIVRQVRDENS